MLTRSKIVAGLILVGTLVSTTAAFAGGGEHERNREHATFPMPAAAFKAKIDARMEKARQHMEARVAQLPADQARAERAAFAQKVSDVNAEVAKAIADGTVTKEEAKAVRAIAPHGHKHEKK